jgi:Leucine-rich repeat (LRR) protein
MQGAEELAETLQGDSTLKMLDLGGCCIQARGLLAITASLVDNTTLTTLALEDCQVLCAQQEQTTRELANLFAANSSLKQVYLGKNGLRDCHLELLVDYGLTKNASLEVLDIRANRLSGLCAPSLSRLLHENSSLSVLSLAHNRIADDSAVAIAEALQTISVLSELDLQFCSITDAGMELLAKAIVHCGTLTRVCVWGNGFGKAAAAAWRDLALSKREQCVQLTMDVEPYEVDGVAMIAFANEDDAGEG